MVADKRTARWKISFCLSCFMKPFVREAPSDGCEVRRQWGWWGGTLAGGGEGWRPLAAAEEQRRRR